MKPHTRKTLLSGVILTAAFFLVLILGPKLGDAESPRRLIVSGVVMGTGIVLAAFVWASGNSNDHHDRH